MSEIRTGKSSFQKSKEILFPFLLYYIVCSAVQIILWRILDYTMAHAGEAYGSFMTRNAETVNGVTTGLYMLAGLAAIGKIAWKEILPVEKKSDIIPRRSVSAWLLLAFFALASATGINIIFYWIGFTTSSDAYIRVAEQQMDVSFGVGLFIFGIISPLAEEVLFRGIIYNRMKKYFAVSVSILLSSFLFGAYHGNIVQGVYGCVMGCLIVFVYDMYGTFAAPFLFHSLANISSFLFSNYPMVYGPTIGPFFGAALVLLAAAAAILMLHKKKAKPADQF